MLAQHSRGAADAAWHPRIFSDNPLTRSASLPRK